MKQRQLGKGGPMVGEIGLGALSFGGLFGATDIATSHRALDRAIDLGITHLDTALIYGPHVSEEVIGAYLKKNKSAASKLVIATKGGIRLSPRGFDNSPQYLRECLESSLRRLGVDHVALYYIHRRDQTIPIEDVTGTLAGFIREGKIGGIGFSEISPASLDRAAAVHQIRAVQSEYSLWTRLPEIGMLQACQRHGAALVAFSPLARGVLSDVVLGSATLPDEFRRTMPRFQEPNYTFNMQRVAAFRQLAHGWGVTPAALALAWLLHKSPIIIPIPGTRTGEHLAEDAAASGMVLSEKQIAEIETVLPPGFAHGHRYSEEQQKGVEQYC